MDAQDKITKQMQEAARNAESQSFPGMERVWESVTERLDGKTESKTVPFFSYKKIAAAAAVLIAVGLGTTYFLNEYRTEGNIAGKHSFGSVMTPEATQRNKPAKTESVTAAVAPVKHTKDNTLAITHQAITYNDNTGISEGNGIPENVTGPVAGDPSAAQAAAPLVAPLESLKVKGKVVDENGEALIGAEIRLKGTSAGTWTDVDGNYELDVTATDPQLEISYTGYDTKDVGIAGNYNVGVTKLAPDAKALTDVVITKPSVSPEADEEDVNTQVVTIEKLSDAPVRDVATVIEGSVPGVQNAGSSNNGILSISPNIVSNNTAASFTASNINLYRNNQYALTPRNNPGSNAASQPYSNYKRQQSNTVNAPAPDVTKAIEGAAPGVQATNGSGAPGAGAFVQVRGKGSVHPGAAPLIILNGAPYNGDINTIRPGDIASVNVLKDTMATNLYGARGANGVIVITTKDYKPGQKNNSGSLPEKPGKSSKRQVLK